MNNFLLLRHLKGYICNSVAELRYMIDRSTSSIQKVKTASSTMKLSPNLGNSGFTINANFGDANEKGSDIIVVSASGIEVRTYHVPAGQTSIQIQASFPNHCMAHLFPHQYVFQIYC